MKLRLTVILLAVVLIPARNILGQSSSFTVFTGNDTFLAMLSPGTTTCPGGQLNPLPPVPPSWSPCTPMPGSRVHSRDGRFLYQLQSSDSRMAGLMEITSANGNYDGWRTDLQPFPGAPGSGQMWGTMRVTVDAHPEEIWEGTWTGTRTVNGTIVVITTHNVLFGTGGRIDGLKAEFTGTADPAIGGAYQGWILAPPGKVK